MKFRLLLFFIIVFSNAGHAQVKIRLFTSQHPESAVFSTANGSYEAQLSNGKVFQLMKDEPVMIMKFDEKIVIKVRDQNSEICDSVVFRGKTGNDSFSLRTNGKSSVKQFYYGDLQCHYDLGTILYINLSDIEKYIAGVVLAEGGIGHSIEFYKTQAVIARTYLYKNIARHLNDRFNVCDDIHCQAFNGMANDPLLIKAVMETRGIVILDRDSALITAAFHSNCGGETSAAVDVWLSGSNYLKSVKDPYCTSSRNATWHKSISKDGWMAYLAKMGYRGSSDPSLFSFEQKTRLANYRFGSFSLPLRTVRSDLNLRSTYFSVFLDGDSVVLKGRGYGHGVGLCQEGAMNMALKGYRYKDIINFYYSGVIISDIKNAVALH